MLIVIDKRPVFLKPDQASLFALALFHAQRGDTSMLEKFKQELIELWNGDGI